MKKLIMFLVFCALLFSNVICVNANLFYEYGSVSYENDFDTATSASITTYPFFISGSAKPSLSTTHSITGYSLEFPISLLSSGGVESILFSFHPASEANKPQNEKYYVEAYVYGFSSTPINLVPYYEYNSKNSSVIDYGYESCGDGWYHLWFTVPVLVDYIIDGHLGWRYTRATSDPQTIWLDSFSMRPIPTELVVKSRSASNTVPFDLSNMSVTAYGGDGACHEVVNKHLVKWSVLNGNAIVRDGYLYFNNTSEQDIELLADFYGVKASATLHVDSYEELNTTPVNSDVVLNNNTYTVSISNFGDSVVAAYVLVTSFVDGKLYKTNITTSSILPNSNSNLICDIPVVPTIIDGVVTSKYFIWTDKYGIITQ